MDSINTRRALLEQRISEMETMLSELKAQLQEEEEHEQHREIDNLDAYLEAMDHKHQNLQEFWQLLRTEVVKLWGGDAEDKDPR